MSLQPILQFNDFLIQGQSMISTFSTPSKDISEIKGAAVQAVWSAGSTPVGATTLEGSLDDINYVTISGSSLSVSGNTGNNLYNIDSPNYKFIRLTYTASSGTGTMSVRISGKL